jgi:hypothetical protein
VSRGTRGHAHQTETVATDQAAEARKKTPTFLLEVPLRVTSGKAKRLRAHLEAARRFYNAILSEGQRRLRRMRADPGGPAARTIPRSQKKEPPGL